MHTTRILAIACLLLPACRIGLADEPGPEARTAARSVAVTTCATCHGRQGRSLNPKFPQLAGQHASYLATQLHNFKAQSRGDADAMAYMWGMSSPLADEVIDGLADYYSTQHPAPGHGGGSSLAARGKAIYLEGVPAEGIPACATCHGPDAAGTDAFPRLAGQSSQYLLKQLRSFQNNMRNMAVMHGVAAGLKGQEMEAVASYLQGL